MGYFDLRKISIFFLWLLFLATFILDFYEIINDTISINQNNQHLWLDIFLQTALLIIEIFIISLAVYYIIKKPKRRLRLISLLSFNILTVAILPMITLDFAWMGALLPWPISLLAFDPTTSAVLSTFSIVFGFVVVPLLTIKFGVKGFCGYICPLGGIYSETYGRLFNNQPGNFKLIGKVIPPVYFTLMTISLLLIWYDSALISPVRKIQIITLFLTSHFFYLIIGIPFIGARSFCTLICPLGYEIRKIVMFKNKFRKREKLIV